jgi:acetyltransferase
MEQTRIFQALCGVRGRAPIDLAALDALLVRFSQLVAEQRMVKEIDINPLLASPERLLALDARVVLHEPGTRDEAIPRLAIRPYPLEYVTHWKLGDGTNVTFRPIRPEDEPLVVRFHQTLSEESVRLRYMAQIQLEQRVGHERLIRVCYSDYDRDLALVVERRDANGHEPEILAIGRLSRTPGIGDAEFALLVADKWQCQGIGTELLRRILDVARAEKIGRVFAGILPENRAMQRVCERLGFRLHRAPDAPVVEAEIRLDDRVSEAA